MSFQYVQPTDEQKATMQVFRDKFQALSDDMNKLPLTIENQHAMEKSFDNLKESSMWLNRALTDNA